MSCSEQSAPRTARTLPGERVEVTLMKPPPRAPLQKTCRRGNAV